MMSYTEQNIDSKIVQKNCRIAISVVIVTLGVATWHCQGLVFRPSIDQLKKNLPQVRASDFPVVQGISIPLTPFFENQFVEMNCDAEIEDSSQIEYSWTLPGEHKPIFGKKIFWQPQKSGFGTITCFAKNKHGCSFADKTVEVFSKKSYRVEYKKNKYNFSKKEDLPPQIDHFSCMQSEKNPFKISCQFEAHDNENDFLHSHVDVNIGNMQRDDNHFYNFRVPSYVQREKVIRIQAGVSDLDFTEKSEVAEFKIPPKECNNYQKNAISPIFWNEMPLRVSHVFRVMANKKMIYPGYFTGKWNVLDAQGACMKRILNCKMQNKFDTDGCVLGALRCRGNDPSKGDPAGDDCCPSNCIDEYFRLRSMKTLCADPSEVLTYVIFNSGCYIDPERSAVASRCFPVRFP